VKGKREVPKKKKKYMITAMVSQTDTTESAAPAKRGVRTGLGDLTPNNLQQLRRLNTILFPVAYSDVFYKQVLEVGELAKMGAYPAKNAGAVESQLLVPRSGLLQRAVGEASETIRERVVWACLSLVDQARVSHGDCRSDSFLGTRLTTLSHHSLPFHRLPF
jgi:hypothetical protein